MNKVGGMSIENVLGFIWAVFSGIITLRLANPLYNTIFGLDWSFSTTATMTKYALMLGFGVIIFAIAFFIPFKIFTSIKEKVTESNKEEYYEGS